MCGISGIYQNQKIYNKNKLEEAIKKINVFQKNRGPDDEGIFIDFKNGVALGHRRLSILDLSKAGKQPMIWQNQHQSSKISINQRLVITFNGEIYNFQELKKDLESKDYKFKTKTDTEAVLALYAEYGEKSFEMLWGMFAFGLWDEKNKKLFLVKDRYGIKPLYYYGDDNKFVFASTVKAIEKSGLIPVKKNQKALIGFLLFGSVPLPMTTVENVFGVPAGHYLEINEDSVQRLVEYYNPLEHFLAKSNDNFESAKEKIKSLLEDSVRYHLISDAPLGVFLSGGLDSSAIAALAAKSLKNQHQSAKIGINQRLKTLSIIFDEEEFSEKKYQKMVVDKIKSDHQEIKITKKDFEADFDEIFEAMDQPTIDGINTFFIAKAAKQAGLKTVLSGLGADEIFLGYSHFKKTEMLRKIQKLPRAVKFLLNILSLFGERFEKLNYLKKDTSLNFYLSIRGLFTPKEISKILNIGISEVEDFISDIENKLLTFNFKLLTSLHPADLLSYLELKFYLQNQLLKDTDFMSMHYSVEVRVPFLDYPLVEYLSSLSPEIKLGQHKSAFSPRQSALVNKPLLAAAIFDLLPQEIFTRPKMGFTFPFQKWMKESSTSNIQSSLLNSHWSRHWAMEVLKKF